MKAGFLLVTALVLAVLCLGSASHATAQSVTGGGTFTSIDSPPPIAFEVAARSGPAGIFRVSQGRQFVLADVVDLCVPATPGNEAVVVAQVTQSTIAEFPPGSFAALFVQDNGNTGDRVEVFLFDPEGVCEDFVHEGTFTVTLTHGNITVTP
jgi:hypothetical protein